MPKISGTEGIKILGHLKKETDKAILLQVVFASQPSEELWFPKSQIREICRATFPGDLDYIVCTCWIAERKNLEYYEPPGAQGPQYIEDNDDDIPF